MVDEVHTDVAAAPATKMTPLQRALLEALSFVVVAAAMVALQGGRPTSLWFYPYTAVLVVVDFYRAYTDKDYGELKAVPGESERRSFEWALVKAVGFSVIIFAWYALLTTDLAQLRAQLVLPVMFVYFVYSRRRGVKPSTKTTFLLALAWLAWYAVFLELWRAFK